MTWTDKEKNKNVTEYYLIYSITGLGRLSSEQDKLLV